MKERKITIRVAGQDYDELMMIASKNKITVSGFIRQILLNFLKRYHQTHLKTDSSVLWQSCSTDRKNDKSEN